jgi:hypothetical protein
MRRRVRSVCAALILLACSLAGFGPTASTTVVQADEAENPPFSTIAVGDQHACGVTPSDYETPRAIYCWGNNDYGQLGVEAGDPSVIEGPLDESEWTAISLGLSHSCAIKVGGSLWCWGANYTGQLGSSGDDTEIPREVAGGITWIAVSAGDDNTCGIDADHAIYCWGDNGNWQLASEGGSEEEPLLVNDDLLWRKIEVSSTHACAIDWSYRLWCWGSNGDLQLGILDSLTSVPQLAFDEFDYDVSYASWRWWDIQVANSVTCGAKKSPIQFVCWGDPSAFRDSASDPIDAQAVPVLLDDTIYTGLSYSSSFDISTWHGCGRIYYYLSCWGEDGDGQVSGHSLDPADHETYYPPILDLGYWTYVKVQVGDAYSCGVKTDYSWWCWGEDQDERLGMRPILPRRSSSIELIGIPESASTFDGSIEVSLESEPAFEDIGSALERVILYLYGVCDSISWSEGDDFFSIPLQSPGTCYVDVSFWGDEEWIASTPQSYEFDVTAAIIRNKRIGFYLNNVTNGMTYPIVGGKVNWRQGAFSGSNSVTTAKDGTALFPTVSVGDTEFTFAGGNSVGFKVLPGKQMTLSVDSSSDATYLHYDYVNPAPGIRLVAPEGQTGGLFAATIPAMTCQYDNLQAVGCTSRPTAFRGSAGVVRSPGWCVDRGYAGNCYQLFDVTVSYTYLGVVQTYTRTWGACLDGSWDCTDEDGTWNFEMDTFPFVEVEPAVVPIWFGETARIEARALGSGRAGLRDYDVLIRPKGRADAGTGCSTTTQTTTDANGNAFLEVCPSRTGTWVVEGGALLPSKEFTINVIRTPSSPLGLELSSTAGVAVLNWDLPEHGGASAISSYRVNYRVAGTTLWKSLRARSIIGLQAQLGALKAGVSYEFRVQAVNRDGAGLWSEIYTNTLP